MEVKIMAPDSPYLPNFVENQTYTSSGTQRFM